MLNSITLISLFSEKQWIPEKLKSLKNRMPFRRTKLVEENNAMTEIGKTDI